MSEMENNSDIQSNQRPLKTKHRGGKFKRLEPQNTMAITSSPRVLSCFQNTRCFQFYERIKQVKSNPELTRILILNLKNKYSDLAGIKFEISIVSISEATGIPSVGEKWFKNGKLERDLFLPFLKRRYRQGSIAVFPFSHLKHRYAPLMLAIMRYFTCEGRYSRVYTYHLRLLTHFTGVKALDLPYYLYRSIVKMSSVVQRRIFPQQMSSLFHHSLIKMVVEH